MNFGPWCVSIALQHKDKLTRTHTLASTHNSNGSRYILMNMFVCSV